jgi:hypothetical protein
VAWARAMAPEADPRLFDMEKVEAGNKAGKSIADLQNTITLASLRSMQSNVYGKVLRDNEYKMTKP